MVGPSGEFQESDLKWKKNAGRLGGKGGRGGRGGGRRRGRGRSGRNVDMGDRQEPTNGAVPLKPKAVGQGNTNRRIEVPGSVGKDKPAWKSGADD